MFIRFGGIDQHSGDLAIAPTSATDLDNVDLHPIGEIRTRGGMTAVEANPEGTGPIIGLTMLENVEGRYLFAAQADGLWRAPVDTDWPWEKATDLVAAQRVRTAYARYGVPDGIDNHPEAHGTCAYFATGEGLPWVDWNSGGEFMQACVYSTSTPGVPTATTGGPEWRDWETHPPTGLAMFGRGTTEQLMAWGFPDDPNRIDYSCLGFPWHFGRNDLDGSTEEIAVDGGWFYALPDEADVVIGVIQMLSRIVVFKRRTTIVYSGFPGVNLAVENIYPVGCTSYDSVVRVGTQLLWWSDQGAVSLFGVQEFGNLHYAVLSDPVRRETTNVSSETAAQIFALHDRKNLRVIWFLPNTTAAKALVYYYDEPRRWTKFSGTLANISAATEGWETAGGEVINYGGDLEGGVHRILRALDDNGEPIDAYYVTAWQAMQDHDVRKRLFNVDMLYGAQGAIDARIEVAWDYSNDFGYEGEMTHVLGTPSLGWNDSLWWTQAEADAWALGSLPAFPNAGFWNQTTQMLARFAAGGTGFLYRLRFSSAVGRQMHFAGWRAFTDEKGHR